MSGTTLPMQEIVALLSAVTGCDQELVTRFLHEFPAVLADGLASDGEVVISGLGTFKLQTGIDGAISVDFAPEAALAETVNEPFAMFESVEVADSLSDEEIVPEKQSQANPADGIDCSIQDSVSQSVGEVTSDGAEERVDVTPPPVPEKYTRHNSRQEVTQIESPHNQPEPETTTEPVLELQDVQGDKAPSAFDTDSAKSPQPQLASKPTAVEVRNRVEVAHSYDSPVPVRLEPESEVAIRRGGHATLTLVSIAVAACLLGLLGGYFLFHQPNIGLPANVEIVEDGILIRNKVASSGSQADAAVAADTIASSAASDSVVQKEVQVEALPQTPSASVTTEVTDTVRPGNYLSVMSRRHYGNPKFWVYIYLENKDKIKDPDNLENGMVLVIPPREKYDIDPSSKESLEKAQREAYNILRD